MSDECIMHEFLNLFLSSQHEGTKIELPPEMGVSGCSSGYHYFLGDPLQPAPTENEYVSMLSSVLDREFSRPSDQDVPLSEVYSEDEINNIIGEVIMEELWVEGEQ